MTIVTLVPTSVPLPGIGIEVALTLVARIKKQGRYERLAPWPGT